MSLGVFAEPQHKRRYLYLMIIFFWAGPAPAGITPRREGELLDARRLLRPLCSLITGLPRV